MLPAPPPISQRLAAAFDVSYALNAAELSAPRTGSRGAPEPRDAAGTPLPDGLMSSAPREAASRLGTRPRHEASPRVAQPRLPDVETARVAAHSLQETAKAHRAVYHDLEDVESAAGAVGALVREHPQELSAAPSLGPLVRVLEALKEQVHGLAASRPAEFGRFRAQEHLASIIRGTDHLAALLKRAKLQMKRAEAPAEGDAARRASSASRRRLAPLLCDVLLGRDQLAAQFWAIAFGGDTFEVKRAAFASCCERVIDQEWLDVQLVERALDRHDRGLVSQLDLSAFVDEHGGMVRGLAATCAPGQTGLHAWGANRRGECGPSVALGDSCSEPVRVDWDLDGRRIRQIACETGISAAVLDSGEVYTWGSTGGGRLGRDDPHGAGSGAAGASPGVDDVPRRVAALQGCPVAFVSCSATYAAAVTEDGQLFSWGSFGEQQAPTLGHRHGEVLLGSTADGCNYSPVPTAVRALRSMHVTHVSCGPEHAAAVTANGVAYCWGSGDRGRLGIGSEVDAWAPQQVADLNGKRVVAVACGTVHTLALTVRGELFVWGGARSGKLGLGGVGFCDTFVHKTRSGQPFVPRPKAVSALAAMHVTHIGASRAHSLAITEEGSLYTWGCGKDGKLGHGGSEPEWLPRRVSSTLTVHIVQAACGREHTSAVTDDGLLFSWGRGVHGKLGVGSEDDVDRPTRVTRLPGPVNQVCCGKHHTLCAVGHRPVSDDRVALYERHLEKVLLQTAATETSERARRAADEASPAQRARSGGGASRRSEREREQRHHDAVQPPSGAVEHQARVEAPVPQHAAPAPVASDEQLGAPGSTDQGHAQSWREKYEEEQRLRQEAQQKSATLMQQLDELHASRAASAPLGMGMMGLPTIDLDSTMDELQVAQEEEQVGVREVSEGQRKKLAAAVTYTRVYQNLEALQQSGQGSPTEIERRLHEVGERMVALRGQLDGEQLHSALEEEELLPAGDWPQVAPPPTRSASASHQPVAAGPPSPSEHSGASTTTASATAEGPDPFETSVQLFKGAKDFAPKHKRDTFVQGIATLEHALQSGKVSAGAMPKAEQLLASAKKTKLELDRSL